jgi:DNA-binding PucR family transcriptional regulator
LRLKEHDSNSQVGYRETLRVYLDSGMNAAQAAKSLYLYRSPCCSALPASPAYWT